jgi:hypothetical protein
MACIKARSKIILNMVMVLLDGTMDKSSKDNGKWEQKTDLEYGPRPMAVTTKANGISICSMEKASTSIPHAFIKAHSKTFVNKGSEKSLSLTATNSPANTKTESPTVRENTNGATGLFTKVNSSTASNKETAHGTKTLISTMKVPFTKTKNTAKASNTTKTAVTCKANSLKDRFGKENTIMLTKK